MMEGKEIGDYWQETLVSGSGAGNTVWHVCSRTGTFTQHCELDAIKAAENAKKELARFNRKQKETFQQKVEYIMEDMLAYYEDLHDIAKEISMWANDYVSMTEQLAKP
jgi:hypothetical protein|tara:strand:- start:62 stop:385 length:324 start_codon:yes stop_codon:yes gene_type:complete